MNTTALIPIIYFIISLVTMVFCLSAISHKKETKYLTKQIWIIIIIFCSLIGQILYIALEGLNS